MCYQRVKFAGVKFVSLIAALTLTIGATVASAAGPGESVVRNAIDSMKRLSATSDAGARRKLLDSIDQSLALHELAKQALGRQWDQLDAAERERFIALFTESLEKLAYPRAAQALSAVAVSYQGEQRQGSAKLVRTTIAKSDGGKIPINYIVSERSGRWQIADVNLDGESISKSVASRIQAALKQEGYRGLVIDMRRQIERADSPGKSHEKPAN